ncbi:MULTISPECIES: hypothetical protein [Streptomyces]|uniref:Secreted protein n=1 Tax=Streptomyces morookaense TaxID=1970 RepID=A0A7Y7B7C0_STRMO|nr:MULTISPECIES: hypothetical protein [Streptomyces]MCC2280481.1 hypothetical protein [Streptomyces sp. ET3-23]NVK80245.1 hypothetical protein [Streptomyces morookaense]GHF40343.1 hypothetical protein GCM10010359_48630 [Streptomyces morookaense]
MSSSRHLPSVLVSAAALLAAAAAPASASDVSPSRTAEELAHRKAPVLVDCLRHDQIAPREYMLACADGNNGLRGLRWKEWTARAAHGTGEQVANDCVPDCAGGRFHTFRVKVEVYRPVHRAGKAPYFSRLKVVYLDERPAGSGPSQTYSLS